MHKNGEENTNAIRGCQNYLLVSYKNCACGTLEHPFGFRETKCNKSLVAIYRT